MALQDYYNTGDDGGQWLKDSDNNQECQTFTANANYSIESVKVLLQKVSTGGVITAVIYATDAGGKPTGASLCSGTNTDNADGTVWHEITFSSSYSLTSGVKYALEIESTGYGFNWRRDGTAPTYSGGSRVYSGDSGNSWTIDTTRDLMFETWGTAFAPPSSGPDITQVRRLVAAANSKIWYEDL